jgi:hypothetical protein
MLFYQRMQAGNMIIIREFLFIYSNSSLFHDRPKASSKESSPNCESPLSVLILSGKAFKNFIKFV